MQPLSFRVTELSWNTFMRRHRRAHLLTGTINVSEERTGGERTLLVLLKGLALACCRSGDYAVKVLRDVDGIDLAMVASAHRADADRLSRTTRARLAPCFAPWSSHRCCEIDAASYCSIALTLARGLILTRTRSSIPRGKRN